MEAVWFFETSVTVNHPVPRSLVHSTMLSEPQIFHLLIGTHSIQNGLQKEMLYRHCFSFWFQNVRLEKLMQD